MDLETVSLGALAEGVLYENGRHICLTCGAMFEDGEIYPMDGRFFDAPTAARIHASSAHGSRLEGLLQAEAKYVKLTDHQKGLLQLLAQGKTDAEIAVQTGASPATVRRQRFMFREKAKRAKVYLALYGLAMEGGRAAKESLVPMHTALPGGQMDDRFVITKAENDKILKTAFESLLPMRLRAMPAKEKKKVAVLNVIAESFACDNQYTEKEINALLKDIYPDDYVSLRRYLIEYGYLQRQDDGSRYWRT